MGKGGADRRGKEEDGMREGRGIRKRRESNRKFTYQQRKEAGLSGADGGIIGGERENRKAFLP